MEKDQIIEKINHFMVEEFEVEPSKIKPEANLKETLQLDSLDYIDLVVVIEGTFGFKVKGEDFAGMTSINDFYDYVHKKLNP